MSFSYCSNLRINCKQWHKLYFNVSLINSNLTSILKFFLLLLVLKYQTCQFCPFVLYKIRVVYGSRHIARCSVSPEMFVWLHLINLVTVDWTGAEPQGHALLVWKTNRLLCYVFSAFLLASYNLFVHLIQKNFLSRITMWYFWLVGAKELLIPNVALNGEATQSSSLYGTSHPNIAIDGDSYTCTTTNATPGAWWQVDLQRKLQITSVTVTG